MAKKFEVPNLANATDTFLVDEIARCSMMMSHLKKLQGTYKEALYARKGKGDQEIPGEMFKVMVKTAPRNAISADLVRELHPEIVAEVTKSTDVTTMRVGALEEVNPTINALIEQLKSELFDD